MSVSEKIRWKRLVNEMRFYHNELELVKEAISTAGPEFHQYYLAYAASHNIDIDHLNRQHSERLRNIYNGDLVKNSPPKNSDLSDSLGGALIHFKTPPELPPTELDDKIRESFHKLFKRLATKLHPDAGGPNISDEKCAANLKLFKEAKNALDNKKYFILLDIAQSLNMAQPRNYKEQIKWMKTQNAILNTQLQQEKDTYNYYFAECETDDDKNELVRKFIAHIFGILT